MATRLLFSFDLRDARGAAAAPPPVLEAMGARPKRQVLSNVWLLECLNDADARAFSNAMAAIQARQHDFVYVVLAWTAGSPDVYVASEAA